jgi:hypothetical protein
MLDNREDKAHYIHYHFVCDVIEQGLVKYARLVLMIILLI